MQAETGWEKSYSKGRMTKRYNQPNDFVRRYLTYAKKFSFSGGNRNVCSELGTKKFPFIENSTYLYQTTALKPPKNVSEPVDNIAGQEQENLIN